MGRGARGLSLMSGGLDSQLAVRVLERAGPKKRFNLIQR